MSPLGVCRGRNLNQVILTDIYKKFSPFCRENGFKDALSKRSFDIRWHRVFNTRRVKVRQPRPASVSPSTHLDSRIMYHKMPSREDARKSLNASIYNYVDPVQVFVKSSGKF